MASGEQINTVKQTIKQCNASARRYIWLTVLCKSLNTSSLARSLLTLAHRRCKVAETCDPVLCTDSPAGTLDWSAARHL
eukprot:126018-Pelagomonas_calceolata.AAC.3